MDGEGWLVSCADFKSPAAAEEEREIGDLFPCSKRESVGKLKFVADIGESDSAFSCPTHSESGIRSAQIAFPYRSNFKNHTSSSYPSTTTKNMTVTFQETKPSHPGLFRIVHDGTPEQFRSKLVAERDFAKGSVIADLAGLTPGPKRYSSVQVSPTEHVELNSDLLYMNHSCDPSALMDVDRRAVVAAKDIKAGDELTFFYPSTEWDMGKCSLITCSSRMERII